MLIAIGFISLGFITLVLGGEILVRGASRLAAVAGVSPLVIGLTVVAFGTRVPELAVSLRASFEGQTDLAVGNVLGSNIFNVLFILGVSSLILPLVVSSQLVRIDVPLMIVASIVALLLGLDGTIGRLDGLGLFAGLICYMSWTIYQSKRETIAVQEEFKQCFADKPKRSLSRGLGHFFLIIGGLILLTFGARWLVSGSVTIARLAGMSELLIGLTIVAVGTSLPEVATSVLASIRGERDIAVGNVVGSNIFNIMCVLGLSAALAPNRVAVSEAAIRFDMPVMIAASIACLPIFFTGHLIDRWEGGLFFGYYVAYITYLVLSVTIPGVSRTFGFTMLAFVLPLTVVALAFSLVRSLRTTSADE